VYPAAAVTGAGRHAWPNTELQWDLSRPTRLQAHGLATKQPVVKDQNEVTGLRVEAAAGELGHRLRLRLQ
jgi:hypothetical protein